MNQTISMQRIQSGKVGIDNISRYNSASSRIKISSKSNEKLSRVNKRSSSAGKESRVIYQDNALRKFTHPSKKISTGCTKIIPKSKFEQLREDARIITKEEREKTRAEIAREKARLVEESIKRKETFRKIDLVKCNAGNKKIGEIEEQVQQRTSHIISRAEQIKLEQEEELKKCNRIILETKCRAIRDAQLVEKKLIEKELAEEEKRLNDLMENDRKKSLWEDVKKEEEENLRKHEYAKMLKSQITNNEEQRVMELERKYEESQLMNFNNILRLQEEVAKMKDKNAEIAKVRKELKECYDQSQRFKAMQREENKIIDLRIREYQKLKDEENARIAEQKKLEQEFKEQERSGAAAQFISTRDTKVRIDEMKATLVQEKIEREWRRKEKEEALKKTEAQKMLLREREDQMRNKRIMQAVEMERDKSEFERILRIQKDAFSREQNEMKAKQKQALAYRSEIMKQINEREKARAQQKERSLEEGLAMRAEAVLRKKKLREAMERKCQEMKENKVPEIYINEVKRMIETIK